MGLITSELLGYLLCNIFLDFFCKIKNLSLNSFKMNSTKGFYLRSISYSLELKINVIKMIHAGNCI